MKEKLRMALNQFETEIDEIFKSPVTDESSSEPEFASEKDKAFVEEMKKYASENGLEVGYSYDFETTGFIDYKIVFKAFNEKNYKAFKKILDFYTDEKFDWGSDFVEDCFLQVYSGLPSTCTVCFYKKEMIDGKEKSYVTLDVPDEIMNRCYDTPIEITESIFRKIDDIDFDIGYTADEI